MFELQVGYFRQENCKYCNTSREDVQKCLKTSKDSNLGQRFKYFDWIQTSRSQPLHLLLLQCKPNVMVRPTNSFVPYCRGHYFVALVTSSISSRAFWILASERSLIRTRKEDSSSLKASMYCFSACLNLAGGWGDG